MIEKGGRAKRPPIRVVEVARVELASKESSELRPTCVVSSFSPRDRATQVCQPEKNPLVFTGLHGSSRRSSLRVDLTRLHAFCYRCMPLSYERLSCHSGCKVVFCTYSVVGFLPGLPTNPGTPTKRRNLPVETGTPPGR